MDKAACSSHLLLVTLFRPVFCHIMTISKQALKPWDNKYQRRQPAKRPKRRFVLYLVTENCAPFIGQNAVPMSPRFKWPFELFVFKHSWRIRDSVFGNPACFDRPENRGINDSSRPYLQTRRRLNDLAVIPWRHQSCQCVGKFMKSKHFFRGRSN